MDSSIEFKEVLRKQATGTPVSYREVAVAIANDEHTLLQFIADNDPVQAYNLLHHSDAALVIGENAKFKPDAKRVAGEFNLLLAKKDLPVLQSIIDEYVIKPDTANYTSNQKVIDSLCDIGAISATDEGYKFNIQF